jgi:hypothetical protein
VHSPLARRHIGRRLNASSGPWTGAMRNGGFRPTTGGSFQRTWWSLLSAQHLRRSNSRIKSSATFWLPSLWIERVMDGALLTSAVWAFESSARYTKDCWRTSLLSLTPTSRRKLRTSKRSIAPLSPETRSRSLRVKHSCTTLQALANPLGPTSQKTLPSNICWIRASNRLCSIIWRDSTRLRGAAWHGDCGNLRRFG